MVSIVLNPMQPPHAGRRNSREHEGPVSRDEILGSADRRYPAVRTAEEGRLGGVHCAL